MRLLTYCACLSAMLAASALYGAEAKVDAAARARAVGPVVYEETAVVGHLDLSRVTPDGLLDFLTELVPYTLGEMRKNEGQLQTWSSALRGVGVKDVYFSLAPLAVFNGPRPGQMSWVVALPTAQIEKAVRAVLPVSSEEGRTVDGTLVIPPWPYLAKGVRPVEHPELAAAFEAVGDTAVQLIVILPADTKRVVGELLPELPKELGGGSSAVLTRGVSWAALGIDLTPQKTLRLMVKAEDAQAAAALRAKLIDTARLIGREAEVERSWPDFDKALALVTPKVESDRLVLTVDWKDPSAFRAWEVLRRPIERVQLQAARRISVDNLKQIGLGMHNYNDAKNAFPSPASRGPDGKPLLSWRVHILRFLDRQEHELYKQFHLDEPWDSPHNRTLIDKMPSIYRLPVSKNKEKGRTNYLLAVGDGAAFSGDAPTRIPDIKDGLSQTIMAVEVDDQHAVIWTKPDDWFFDPNDPVKGLGRFFADGTCFNALICDGSVRSLLLPKDPKGVQTLRAMFTRAGGETIDWSSF